MKSRPLLFCLCLAVAACHRSEPATAAKQTAPEKTSGEKKPGEAEAEGLKFSKEAQELSGIKVAPVESASLASGFSGFGRVLDPGPLIQQVSDLATARAASDASTRDLERTRKLNTMGENASAHALETADATARRDALAADLAAQKIVAAWGTVLASREDLPAFVQRLVRQEAALVRLDVPAGQVLTQPPAGITLSAPANSKVSWSAQFISFAASADPQTQTQGIIAVVEKTPPPIGLTLTAQLSAGGDAKTGLRVPRSALVRFGDGQFVFVQKDAEAFERHAVDVAGDVGGDLFVTEGLAAGDHIVIAGAQQLLSEELKGSAPAAD